jgi:hypothetical protein
MPGCILRIQSKNRNLDTLIEALGVEPAAFRKGEKQFPSSKRLNKVSAFNVVVSDALGAEIERQDRDAVRFLRRNSAGLKRLRRCVSFNGMDLDFGFYDVTTSERIWPSYRLSCQLIELAGKHQIGIVLSFYGPIPKSWKTPRGKAEHRKSKAIA